MIALYQEITYQNTVNFGDNQCIATRLSCQGTIHSTVGQFAFVFQ